MLCFFIFIFYFFAVHDRGKEAGAQNEDSGHIRFFSFSLIEGYISLVMDEQTTRRLDLSLTSIIQSTGECVCVCIKELLYVCMRE